MTVVRASAPPPAQRRPSITPAQILAACVAGVPVISNLLLAFRVYTVTAAEQHALTEAMQWGAVFGALLVGGDAHLRGKRNEADATKAAAVTQAVIGSAPAATKRAAQTALGLGPRNETNAPPPPRPVVATTPAPEPAADDEPLDETERVLGQIEPPTLTTVSTPADVPPDEGNYEAAAQFPGGAS